MLWAAETKGRRFRTDADCLDYLDWLCCRRGLSARSNEWLGVLRADLGDGEDHFRQDAHALTVWFIAYRLFEIRA